MKGTRKNAANLITCVRLVSAVFLPLTNCFTLPFWIWYGLGAASDALDGFADRKLGTVSEAGAKLDSAADLCFFAALLFRMAKDGLISRVGAGGAAAVLILRLAAYAVGFLRFHTFAALHTWLNKAAGFLLAAFPVLARTAGPVQAEWAVVLLAAVSAAEEGILLIRMPELRRDCRGWWD